MDVSDGGECVNIWIVLSSVFYLTWKPKSSIRVGLHPIFKPETLHCKSSQSARL